MDKLTLSLNTRYIQTMMRCLLILYFPNKWGQAVDQIEKWIIEYNYGHWTNETPNKSHIIKLHEFTAIEQYFGYDIYFQEKKN